MEISKIIKYEGDNNTFIWKYPEENFNTTSQLIVHESQEAILFVNGKALDVFNEGRHTFETQNIPLLKKLINLPTSGKSPFHCEIYFINKIVHMALRWGTDSKIQYIDPIFNFPLSVGASGEMSLSVENGKKLLLKLVGTENDLSQEKLISFFRAFLMTRVKSYIANVITDKKINIFEIDKNLTDFSDNLKELLIPDFIDFGIALEKFLVTTVVKPEDDEYYIKFKDLYYRQYAEIAEAELKKKVGIIEQQKKKEQMIIESEGIAEKRKTEGYTYQQERGFNVAENLSKNEGNAGSMAGMGIGIGMLTGVGNTVGGVINSAVNNALNSGGNKFCENCGAKISDDALYCEKCGLKLNINEKCINCGYVFTNEALFCPKCGKKRG